MTFKFNNKKGFPFMPSIEGVELSSVNADIGKSKKLDLLLIKVSPGSKICGLLTKSKTCSAAVKWCRKNLKRDQNSSTPLGIIVNSGNANVFTGATGKKVIKKTVTAVRNAINSTSENIFVASTGVIGEPLDYSKITRKIDSLVTGLSKRKYHSAAKAIMTTDTYPKGASAQYTYMNESIKINGIAKGSGMIEPDMATMLVFIFSDISIDKSILQKIIKECNKSSFNSITVDSDTSTSDSLLCIGTGSAKMAPIKSYTDPRAVKFREVLEEVMMQLAYLVVRDGEGATKFIEVKVTGAKSKKSAFIIGKSIANSPLVKTAFAGEDPNWGRVVMAVGKSGEEIKPNKISIYFGDFLIAEQGSVSKSYSEIAVKKYMKNDSIFLKVDVGLGSGEASVYTCDLTQDYVVINADYRS